MGDTKSGGDRMPRTEELTGAGAPASDVRQVPPPAPGSGFLRIRMGVENGRLVVRSTRFVETGHVVEEPLRAGYAYEFTARGRRVWAANLADFGVRRSFPNPQGPPAQQVHHVIDDPDPRFEARVPAGVFSTTDIDQVEAALYRLTEVPQAEAVGAVVPGRATPTRPLARMAAPSTAAGASQAPLAGDGELVARAGPGVLTGLPAEDEAALRRALAS